ncbi:hypothetical protein V1294_003648 [Bradyrhizobium sp. AZCC 1678]
MSATGSITSARPGEPCGNRGFAARQDFSRLRGCSLGVPVILVRHVTTQEFEDYRLVWLVAETELILLPLFLPQSLFFFLPRAAPGTRPKLVGNTFASLFALGGLAILLLLGLIPREAVAAQELYETGHEYIHKP